jgi:hypothetical protein
LRNPFSHTLPILSYNLKRIEEGVDICCHIREALDIKERKE